MAFHRKLVSDDIHVGYIRTYANENSRVNDISTDLTLPSVAAEEIGKWVRQDSPLSWWSLESVDPADPTNNVWTEIGGVAISELPFDDVTDPAGNAAVTTAKVDAFSGTVITLTSAGNSQTIGDPTTVTPGRKFFVLNNNISSDTIAVNGTVIAIGQYVEFRWDGTAWLSIVPAVASAELPYTTAADPAVDAAVSTAIIDNNSGTVITLTASGNNQTLQAPTDTTAGRKFFVLNNDTSNNPILVNGIALSNGEFANFRWDGSAWLSLGGVPVELPYAVSVDPAVDAAVTTPVIDANQGTVITLTGPGNNQTLADPTDTSVGREFFVLNNDASTSSIFVNGKLLLAGQYAEFRWDGTAWLSISPGTALSELPFDVVVDPAVDAAVTTGIIDLNSGTVITLTSPGNSQTLQSPTDTTAGRKFFVLNNDTSNNSITVNGKGLSTGQFVEFRWDGTGWLFTSGGTTELPFTTALDPAVNVAVSTAIINANSGTVITLSAVGNNQTLQAPTDVTAGRKFFVMNNDTSTDDIIVNATTLVPGDYAEFRWDGTAWLSSVGGSGESELPFTASSNPSVNAAVSTAIIDLNSGTIVTLTTTGTSQTLASPTDTTAGRKFFVINDTGSTDTLPVNGRTLFPGQGSEFRWDGAAWVVVIGIGDVDGPTSSTLNAFPRFADTTGKLIKDGPIVSDDSGNLSGLNNTGQAGYSDFVEISTPATPAANAGRIYAKDVAGTTRFFFQDAVGLETDLTNGDVTGPASSTLNAFARYSDATGKIIKDGPIVSDNSGNLSGLNNTGQAGYSDFVEISTPATPAASVGRIYTKDVAGTTRLFFQDSSAIETDLTSGDVTKVGTPVDNQVAVWAGSGPIEGDDHLTFDGSQLKILGNILQRGGEVGNLYTPVLESTTVVGTTPRASVIFGNYLFVIDSTDELMKIFDVTDPTTPDLKGSVSTGTGTVRGIDVAGRYVYVVDASGAKLLIIDHIDKSTPVLVSTLALVGTGSLRGVRISGNIAFITSNAADFTSVDVTDPNNPVQLETLTGFTQNSRSEFDVVGKYAYLPLTSSGDSLRVVDVEDPANMIILGTIAIFGGPFSVKVEGNLAYAIAVNALHIIDIHDPNNLSLVSATSLLSDPRSMFVANGIVYVADLGLNAFVVLDARDPSNVVKISTNVALGTNPVSLSIAGNFAYVLDSSSDSLYIINVFVTDIQAAQIGSAIIGDLQVKSDINVGKRITTSSIIVGTGGILSGGPISAQGKNLAKLPTDVIEITQASDFNPVGGIITPPSLSVQYRMLAPVVTTDRFVLPTDQTIVFTSPFQDTNSLTYAGSGTFITAADLSDLRLESMNMIDAGSGTLFGITAGSSPGIITIEQCGIFNFASLGSMTGFPIVSIRNSIFVNNADGFTFADCTIGLTNIQYLNFSDTGSTFFTIGGTANIGFTVSQAAITLQAGETIFDISSGIGSDSSINIRDIVRTLGVASGTFFDAGGIDGTDVRVSSRDNDGVPDSTVSAQLFLEGNTAVTSIPLQNAFVEINTDVNWTNTEVERINAGTDGSAELTSLRDVKLKLDGNINLEPAAGGAQDLSVRTIIAQPTVNVVTFTNGTDIINETTTPRLVNELISFRDTAGTLPAELRTDIIYYVINVTVNAFQVAYTEGGVAIAFTDDGTGTNSYKVCELHGSTPVNIISPGSPRDLVPHAVVPAQTASKTFPVVENKSGSQDILVKSGYQRYFV